MGFNYLLKFVDTKKKWESKSLVVLDLSEMLLIYGMVNHNFFVIISIEVFLS